MQNAEATGPETKPPAESLELLALAERLRLRAHRMARAQYLAAKRVSRMHNFLGVPVVVLTAAVGTSLFATAGSGSGRAVSITAGLLSALAAAAAAADVLLPAVLRQGPARAAPGTGVLPVRQAHPAGLQRRPADGGEPGHPAGDRERQDRRGLPPRARTRLRRHLHRLFAARPAAARVVFRRRRAAATDAGARAGAGRARSRCECSPQPTRLPARHRPVLTTTENPP